MHESLVYSRFYWHMELLQQHKGLKNVFSLKQGSLLSSAEG